MSARLFIRNDDVWTLDAGFRDFFEAAMERGIPVVHAVIPGKMEDGLIRFLCQAKEKTPHLLDIVQHGWMHANYSDTASKYEFGGKRSFKEQQEDIRRGLKKMKEAFGDLLTPGFVPPYHGYNEDTLRALYEDHQSFPVLSVGWANADARQRFREIPAEVSFNRYEPGKPRVRPLQEVMAEMLKSINQQPLTGVLTHHAEFTTDIFRRDLAKFFDHVAALKTKEQWQLLLFSDML